MANKQWGIFFAVSIIAIAFYSTVYLLVLKTLHAPLDKWAMVFLFVNPVSLSILTTAIYFAIKDVLHDMK